MRRPPPLTPCFSSYRGSLTIHRIDDPLVGLRIGVYEIVSRIGAGGMGDVYRARDLRLGRDVAVKILPEAFLADPDRRARFEREARVLASLSHPNIAVIHGVEDADSSSTPSARALVLEYVEGSTLASLLSRGPLPVAEAVGYARQIAAALDAAHSKGIIHRDLKPANIMVTPDGTVKLLDFGLAAIAAGDASDDSTLMVTKSAGTGAGVIMGTVAYMSPEQARGEVVDKRTDIWAFGCVLFEMLTGSRAFDGATPSDVIARVIERDPDFSRLPADTPAPLRRLVVRCLTKDPRNRLRDIGDAHADLVDTSPAPSGVRRVRAPLAVWAAVVGLAGVLAGFGLASLRPAANAPHAIRGHVEIGLPDAATFSQYSHPLAISPDGQRIVIAMRRQLYERRIDHPAMEPLAGTERARSPFFSPDGRWVGFWQDGMLKKVSVDGGVPITLCRARNLYGAHWSRGGRIIFGQGPLGIHEVSADGGEPSVLVAPDASKGELGFQGPQLLPDGRSLLYTELQQGENWNGARIVVRNLDSGETRVLIEDGTDARYVPTGHIVFARGTTLLSAAFDPASLAVHGAPVPIAEGVSQAQLWETGASHFSFSETGTLVYVPTGTFGTRRLVWVDRTGDEEELPTPERFYMHPRLSPDGRRIVVDTVDTLDLWLYEIERASMRRLTVEQTNLHPVWSADGKWIIFDSTQGAGLHWVEVDGPGREVLLRDPSHLLTAVSASSNGLLAIERSEDWVAYDIAVLSLDGDRVPKPWLSTPFREMSPIFSPDGHWIAYVSNESGVDEVYVQAYPGPGPKYLISSGGGREPLWSRDGSELFYRAGSSMMAVGIETVPTFRARPSIRLFNGNYSAEPISAHPTYDVSPDGRRFLMIKDVEEGTVSRTLHVVFDWFGALRERMEASRPR